MALARRSRRDRLVAPGVAGAQFYAATFTDYNASYGAVGGAMVLMLWFHVSGLAILIGAELNSEIDHAATLTATHGVLLTLE